MADLSKEVFDKIKTAGLSGVSGTEIGRERMRMKNGHVFMNMSSCSYLGLNDFPSVKKGLLLGIKESDPWSAVRVLEYANEDELFFTGKRLFEKGYYTSTIAFPTVKRGEAGLRVMIRANMYDEEIKEFADLTRSIKNEWTNNI